MSLWTSFRTDDVEQMKRVENEVARTLAPFRGNTEAALAVFALVRCARLLLRLYPAKTQKELIPVLVDYLQGNGSAEPESRLFLQ